MGGRGPQVGTHLPGLCGTRPERQSPPRQTFLRLPRSIARVAGVSGLLLVSLKSSLQREGGRPPAPLLGGWGGHHCSRMSLSMRPTPTVGKRSPESGGGDVWQPPNHTSSFEEEKGFLVFPQEIHVHKHKSRLGTTPQMPLLSPALQQLAPMGVGGGTGPFCTPPHRGPEEGLAQYDAGSKHTDTNTQEARAPHGWGKGRGSPASSSSSALRGVQPPVREGVEGRLTAPPPGSSASTRAGRTGPLPQSHEGTPAPHNGHDSPRAPRVSGLGVAWQRGSHEPPPGPKPGGRREDPGTLTQVSSERHLSRRLGAQSTLGTPPRSSPGGTRRPGPRLLLARPPLSLQSRRPELSCSFHQARCGAVAHCGAASTYSQVQ